MKNNNEYVVVMVSSFIKIDNDFFVKVLKLNPAKTKISSSNVYNFAHFSRVMSYRDAAEEAASFIADGFFVTILNTRTTRDGYLVGFSALDLVSTFNSIKNGLYEDDADEEEVDEDETKARPIKINKGPCHNPQLGRIVEDNEDDEW